MPSRKGFQVSNRLPRSFDTFLTTHCILMKPRKLFFDELGPWSRKRGTHLHSSYNDKLFRKQWTFRRCYDGLHPNPLRAPLTVADSISLHFWFVHTKEKGRKFEFYFELILQLELFWPDDSENSLLLHSIARQQLNVNFPFIAVSGFSLFTATSLCTASREGEL